MKNLRLLTIVICLISLFVFMEANAHAGDFGLSAWSKLCFWYEGKGPNGTIQVDIDEIHLTVLCENFNASKVDCEESTGLTGRTTVVTDVTEADTGRNGKIVDADGCIDFSNWDHHWVYDDDGNVVYDDTTGDPIVNPLHIDPDGDFDLHVCHSGSSNMVEVPETMHAYEVTGTFTRYSDNGRLIDSGTFDCTWDGDVYLDVCDIEHNTTFTCELTTSGTGPER